MQKSGIPGIPGPIGNPVTRRESPPGDGKSVASVPAQIERLLGAHLPEVLAKLTGSYLVANEETLALVSAGQVALASLQDLIAQQQQRGGHLWVETHRQHLDDLHILGRSIADKLAAVADGGEPPSKADGEDIDFVAQVERYADAVHKMVEVDGIFYSDSPKIALPRNLLLCVARHLTVGEDLGALDWEDRRTFGQMVNLLAEIQERADFVDNASKALPPPEIFLESPTAILGLSEADRRFVANELDAGIAEKREGYAVLGAALDTLVPGWRPFGLADCSQPPAVANDPQRLTLCARAGLAAVAALREIGESNPEQREFINDACDVFEWVFDQAAKGNPENFAAGIRELDGFQMPSFGGYGFAGHTPKGLKEHRYLAPLGRLEEAENCAAPVQLLICAIAHTCPGCLHRPGDVRPFDSMVLHQASSLCKRVLGSDPLELGRGDPARVQGLPEKLRRQVRMQLDAPPAGKEKDFAMLRAMLDLSVPEWRSDVEHVPRGEAVPRARSAPDHQARHVGLLQLQMPKELAKLTAGYVDPETEAASHAGLTALARLKELVARLPLDPADAERADALGRLTSACDFLADALAKAADGDLTDFAAGGLLSDAPFSGGGLMVDINEMLR